MLISKHLNNILDIQENYVQQGKERKLLTMALLALVFQIFEKTNIGAFFFFSFPSEHTF